MLRLFVLGGPFMWILLLLGLTVLVLTIREAIALLRGRDSGPARTGNGSGAILFWGCIASVLGLLGTLNALYLSMWTVRQAGAINPSLMAEGVAVALISAIFGLLILACSAIAWFTLRWWRQRAGSRESGPVAAPI